MFCIKCGQKLESDALFCFKCGNKVQAHDDAANETALLSEETVIMKGMCSRVNRVAQNGTGTLTNKRFIYQEREFGRKIPIIGFFYELLEELLSVERLPPEDLNFAIHLSDIGSIEDGKHSFCKTTIINTKSGQTFNFIFYFTKREQWKRAIQNAINEL